MPKADFSKIIGHPDKQRIIDKLVSGDPPKTVAEYLKIKYDAPDQAHLRIPITLLTEFKDNFLDRHKFLEKLVKDDQSGKLDKKVYDSLLNNNGWKERLAEFADKEVDLKRTIQQVMHLLLMRAEQVYDFIQTNPKNLKGDYVLIKYFDSILDALEKGDKVINERPDTLIQNNISIQMVEQESVAMQEAIKETLMEMDPEMTALFMEKLAKKQLEIQSHGSVKPRSVEMRMRDIKQMLPADIQDIEDTSLAFSEADDVV